MSYKFIFVIVVMNKIKKIKVITENIAKMQRFMF